MRMNTYKILAGWFADIDPQEWEDNQIVVTTRHDDIEALVTYAARQYIDEMDDRKRKFGPQCVKVGVDCGDVFMVWVVGWESITTTTAKLLRAESTA